MVVGFERLKNPNFVLVSIVIMDVLDSCNQHIGMAENGSYNIYIYIFIICLYHQNCCFDSENYKQF